VSAIATDTESASKSVIGIVMQRRRVSATFNFIWCI
jgi:hypothetical protein